jgi:RND family efflux transporter MFP subunit
MNTDEHEKEARIFTRKGGIFIKMTSKFWAMMLLSLFLAGCAGGGAATPTLVPTPVTVEKPTYTVQRGTVTQTAQLNGRVTPVQQQDLFFRSDGFVKEVLVGSGDSVREGDVLARLDEPERYQADVAAAELAVAQAQSALDQARLDAPIQLANAKTGLAQAAKDLDKAQQAVAALAYPHVTDGLTLEKFRTALAIANKNLEDARQRYDDLYGRPVIDAERAQALDALLKARHDQYLAQINLDWAEGKVTQAEIDQADNNLALAQATYDKAAAEVERWQPDNPAGEVRLAELTLADAQARLAMAQQAQADIELQAPFSGQVLSLGIAPGSSVKAFQAVLTLADPSNLEVAAVPSAADLAQLGSGQPAVIRLSSRQGSDFDGKITRLPLAVSSNSGADSQDTTVHFSLDDPSVQLALGDAATILVTIDSRTDVLWLPPAAIRSFQDQDFVFVESGGVQRRVNVTVGLRSAERVEIVSGLEEGQTVVGQ